MDTCWTEGKGGMAGERGPTRSSFSDCSASKFSASAAATANGCGAAVGSIPPSQALDGSEEQHATAVGSGVFVCAVCVLCVCVCVCVVCVPVCVMCV